MRLIYFSPVPAASYAQRPHFLVQAFCHRGVEKVLWVEPYPTRLPQGSDFRRPRGGAALSMSRDDRVEGISVPALPIEPLPGGTWLNRCVLWPRVWKRLKGFAAAGAAVLGIGKPSALALCALRRLCPAFAFYDAMDDFPEFHRGWSRRSTRNLERIIAGEVD